MFGDIKVIKREMKNKMEKKNEKKKGIGRGISNNISRRALIYCRGYILLFPREIWANIMVNGQQLLIRGFRLTDSDSGIKRPFVTGLKFEYQSLFTVRQFAG